MIIINKCIATIKKTMNMKKIFAFESVLMLTLSILFPGCSDDKETPSEKPIFPEVENISVSSGESYDLSFTANLDWTLTIDKSWCRFDDHGVKTAQLSGKAADNQSVKIVISDEGLGFEDETAVIDMTMGSAAPQPVFRITRQSLTPTIQLWIHEETGWIKADKLEFSYNNDAQEVSPIEIGLSANYDWKIISWPEGLELDSTPFGGKANIQPEDGEFRSTFVRIPDAHMADALSGEISIVDVNTGNIRRDYNVVYQGFDSDMLVVKGESIAYHSISFSNDGYVLFMGDMKSDKNSYEMSVYAQNMTYTAFVVTKSTHPMTGMPQYNVANDDFWVKMTDDKRGNVSIAVDSNSGAQREAYVCIFPGTVPTESSDLQFYIESNDYADNRWKITQKGGAVVIVEGSIELYWEKQDPVACQITKAQDDPKFSSYVVERNYPAERTFAYTFSDADVEGGGRLFIASVGFYVTKMPQPESLYGVPFPTNDSASSPLNFGFYAETKYGIYYDLSSAESGSIAALSLGDQPIVLILEKK